MQHLYINKSNCLNLIFILAIYLFILGICNLGEKERKKERKFAVIEILVNVSKRVLQPN